jgi:hypothetical protein
MVPQSKVIDRISQSSLLNLDVLDIFVLGAQIIAKLPLKTGVINAVEGCDYLLTSDR